MFGIDGVYVVGFVAFVLLLAQFIKFCYTNSDLHDQIKELKNAKDKYVVEILNDSLRNHILNVKNAYDSHWYMPGYGDREPVIENVSAYTREQRNHWIEESNKALAWTPPKKPRSQFEIVEEHKKYVHDQYELLTLKMISESEATQNIVTARAKARNELQQGKTL